MGGTIKLATKLEKKPIDFLQSLPDGKITLGISDYSKDAKKVLAQKEALKLKKILTRHGRSVRVVENKDVVLSTATSLHNGLSGKNERKVELITINDEWFKVVGIQDIDAYSRRDQARPARDAKVGMLPPKLAQILINLCGNLKSGATVLDPFCGTGVLLQEALLMGYYAYGTDLSERMVDYSEKNLKWLIGMNGSGFTSYGFGGLKNHSEETFKKYRVSQGDATDYKWQQPIDAVACEGYLGRPFSKVPTGIELKKEEQTCSEIVLGFLKNLASQIVAQTPVVMAIPAWLNEDGTYKRLEILDEIDKLGYNVGNKTREGLLYCREGQIVARDILILRKK